MGNVRIEDTVLPARDGYGLAATVFEPSGDRADAAVLVGCAMGVPRGFYRRFASFLAEQGLPAVTVDYRGIGGSAPDRLRGFDATLRDWARLDLAGVLDHMEERFEGDRLVMAGHSVAGQLFGLVPGNDRVEALATVASVKGYWRLWPTPYQARLWILWYVITPPITRLAGYFPASLVGLGGEDLPRGVAEEWTRWGRNPAYMCTPDGRPLHEGFRSYPGRVRAYSLSDDWYAPETPVAAWLELFETADAEHLHLSPQEFGVEEIGHFGFFRDVGRRTGLWEEMAGWLIGP